MGDREHVAATGDVIELSAIAPSAVTWLHRGWIPYGKISLLHGPPGYRKTGIALDLAARASAGGPMPLSAERFEPVGVLLMALEDGLGDTVQPLLVAAGADLKRIAVLGDVEDTIPGNLHRIEEVCVERGVRLLIIDYLDDCLSPRCSTQSTDGIRRAMRALATMAERLNLAVLIIRHEVKAQGGLAIHRSRGSVVIAGTARSVMTVAPHPQDTRLMTLSSVKLNLGPKPKALVFTTEPAGSSSRVSWLGEVDLAIDVPAEVPETRAETAIDAARRLLETLLAAGPVAVRDLEEAADAEGIAGPTLRRARQQLGVRAMRGRGEDRAWYLSLPSDAPARRDGLPRFDQELLQHDDHLEAEPLPHPELALQAAQSVPHAGPDPDAAGDQDDRVDHPGTDRFALGGSRETYN